MAHPSGSADATSPAVRRAAPGPRTDAGSSPRVLIVDDNRDAAELLGEALADMGYEVQVAFDGLSALALAAEFRPHVGLLDIGLPVMDGYALAPRLLGLVSGLRLVAITGYGQEADRQRSRDAGFHLHLVKPVDLDALQAVLAQMLPRTAAARGP